MKNLSIKKLTLLGFTLVSLPLVFALLYSANQINQLSTLSSNTIFDVAEIINTNKNFTNTLKKMERYASQYVVLNDEELIENYLLQEQVITDLINNEITKNQDPQLHRFSIEFINITTNIHQLLLLMSSNKVDKLSLEQLQPQFKQLTKINEKITLRNNALINLQAKQIKNSAEHVSSTMLKSLVIIPITLLIAALFIVLITKPLKRLTKKIQRLEQGDFQKKIELEGSAEIREIADALEIMRTRLHALELQKSSFIRHISHELKTPLAAIREGTELLYDNSVGALNEGQQEVCQIIKSSVTRLQQLIEDLLDFNIVLDSTSLQDSEKLNLSTLLAHVLTERKLDLKRKKIEVIQQVLPITLYSNAKQLMVILDNILSNAIKYSPINGVININAKITKQQLILTIIDQGLGIENTQKNKIFDPFYQGNAPTDNQIKSSGLGLTIVKELLLRLNGSVTITSNTQAPSYTSVQILLPRAHYSKGEK